jgi:transposase-like protein
VVSVWNEKERNRRAIMGGCKAIFAAPSRAEAIHRFRAWKKPWEVEEPGAVRCLVKDQRECLAYYDFD